MKVFESKLGSIAEKYAELVERRLTKVLNNEHGEISELSEINESIRELHRMAIMLVELDRKTRGNEVMEEFKKKVESIAEKYAELTEKRLIAALDNHTEGSAAIAEIEQGIKMLYHILKMLKKLDNTNNEQQ